MKTTGSNLKQTPPAPARGKSAGRNAQVVVEESHGGIGGRGRSSPPDKPQINWTAARVARLGKEGDTSLARSLGVRMVVVRRKRLELGVPKYQKVEWTPELIAKLGQDIDVRVARELGVSKREVYAARHAFGIPPAADVRWTAEVLARLGKWSDASVAEELGLTRQAVHVKRTKLGIPPAFPH